MEKELWSSLWKEEDMEELKKMYIEFMHDNNDDFKEEDFNPYRFNEWAIETKDMYLMDLRQNTDVETKNGLVICADLGLWHGRVTGVGKVLPTNNLSDLFFSDFDDVRWYCDDKDLRADMYHHDGTNHYIYRELKDGVDSDEVFNLMYNRQFDEEAMEKYTTSVKPYLNKIYGWD